MSGCLLKTPRAAIKSQPFFIAKKRYHPKAFALVVKGDSMEPLFLEGETLIVDPGRKAMNGSYIIAKNGDNEATFKQLVVDGPNVYLRSLNTELYKQWDMTGVQFSIIGVVVAKEQRY